MVWLRVDDSLLDHPKWVRAVRTGGSAAVHMWLCMATWCARHLTDGVIPGDIMATLGGPDRNRSRALEALLVSGLCSRSDGDVYTLHDFTDYNPTREQVQRERDRKSRTKRNSRLMNNVSADTHKEVSADTAASRSQPSPAQPDPYPPLVVPVAVRPKQRRVLWHVVPEGWQPTAKHRERTSHWSPGLFDRELEKFRSHEFAQGKSDPDRTFTRWLAEAETRLKIQPRKVAPKIRVDW